MSQEIKIAAQRDIELHIKHEAGRRSAFEEAQQYLENEAKNAFMVFTKEGDTRAFELRSLAAMFGRWGDAATRAIEQTRALAGHDESAADDAPIQ